MKGIRLICVGKTDSASIREMIEEFRVRANRFIPVEIFEITDYKARKNSTVEDQKTAEGKMIMAQITSADKVLLLDERGVQYSSRSFAKKIESLSHTIQRWLVLVIGGPYGFSEEIYDAYPERLSLSKMTFNHQMVRLFATEQIYRALTILNNHPYHND